MQSTKRTRFKRLLILSKRVKNRLEFSLKHRTNSIYPDTNLRPINLSSQSNSGSILREVSSLSLLVSMLLDKRLIIMLGVLMLIGTQVMSATTSIVGIPGARLPPTQSISGITFGLLLTLRKIRLIFTWEKAGQRL